MTSSLHHPSGTSSDSSLSSVSLSSAESASDKTLCRPDPTPRGVSASEASTAACSSPATRAAIAALSFIKLRRGRVHVIAPDVCPLAAGARLVPVARVTKACELVGAERVEEGGGEVFAVHKGAHWPKSPSVRSSEKTVGDVASNDVHLSAAMRTVPQVHCDVGSTHMPPMPTTTEPSGRKVTCHVSTWHSDCNTVTRENVTAPSVKSHAVMRDVTASRTALTSSHSTSVGGARSSSRLSQGTCVRARCVRAINPVRVRTAAEAAISRQGSWRPPWGHDRLVVTGTKAWTTASARLGVRGDARGPGGHWRGGPDGEGNEG
eukprot:CAMPEP_0185541486 /NCGR_PEP_ID=MMETSP1381-20130426/1991_1 /TAXON_ID=298111 /ORGANISM="Pavlova sp., Strain CCMP459" /LENGTH=319 /DNA_ID=CAMNT_0028153395 /DNA_START=438 /DNA_END=1401 /DNA_ORIENTATION=-